MLTRGSIDAVDIEEAATAAGMTTTELAARTDLSRSDDLYSRSECQLLGLQGHRPGDPPGYWLTVTQAAETLGVSRQYLDRLELPHYWAAHGWRLVRRYDLDRFAAARDFRRQVEWLTYVEAAMLAGRSTTWIRNNANRGLIRRRVDSNGSGRRWVARQDVEQLARQLDESRVRRHDRTTPEAPPGAMSIADAARALDVDRSYVHVLARRGTLRMHSRGRPASYVDAASVGELLRVTFDGHEPTDLMTYTEAAAALGMSVEQVRRRIRRGLLRSVGRTRRKRVLRAEVLQLLGPDSA